MEKLYTKIGSSWRGGVLAATSVFVLSGCLATRDWVRETIDPLSGRVSQSESRLGQTEGQLGQLTGRMSAAESKISSNEAKLGEVDAKAERALAALGNLKLQRRLVIDLKEGANFAFNSAVLPPQAKKEIDGFLSDLRGDLAGGENAVFLVAGHTDDRGKEDFNFELGKRRAEAVSRYLMTQKKVDPLRVLTVSYGATSPVAENKTRDGRAKNRRVEILVYQETINSNVASTPQQEQKSSQRSEGTTLMRSF